MQTAVDGPGVHRTASNLPIAGEPCQFERMLGTISVDCDTLEDYARGYGFAYRDERNRIFERALPRFLDLFGKQGVRATFFVVGRDLLRAEHRTILRRAVAEGHELANHTWSHPRQFAGLPRRLKEAEIRRSHDLVADEFGVQMKGFRAPCYDMDAEAADLLERLGYRYDSSAHPSAVISLFDFVLWIKSRFQRWEMHPSCLFNGFAPTTPYYPAPLALWRRGGQRSIVELPLSVRPRIRVPFYGTWHLLLSDACFRQGLKSLVRHRACVNYHFHAVELLGLAEDGVDRRFARHPGMHLPVQKKTDLVRTTLERLSRHYRLVTTLEFAEKAVARLSCRRPRFADEKLVAPKSPVSLAASG